MTQQLQQAMFGAGCFWGVQYYFDQIPGVVRTTAGYSGGHTEDPDWHKTHEQETGHAEVVLIEFDPQQVSYETLARHFFRMHDPTLLNNDGINFGTNYRSCAFFFDEQQQQTIEEVRDEVQAVYATQVVTEIAPAKKFWEAEAIHQKYAERTGRGICHIPYQPIEK